MPVWTLTSRPKYKKRTQEQKLAAFRRDFGLITRKKYKAPESRTSTKKIRLSPNDIRREPREALRRWLSQIYHMEYNKQYTKTVKWKVINANNMSRRRAAMKGSDVDTAFLLDLWDKTTECPLCHKPLGLSRHLDHIIPIVIGGRHMKNNVRYVHPFCNSSRPKDGSDLRQ